MNKKKILKKSHNRKKSKRKLTITYEILPSGILTRNSENLSKSPRERWEEIINICAEAISENETD